MSNLPDESVLREFIEEVKSYIAPLTDGINTLMNDPDQKNAGDEIHRLVHIIKGASSMMGVNGLSHIACQMEELMEDILAGEFTVTDEALKLMLTTIDHFNDYTAGLCESTVDVDSLLTETVLAYRRLRGLPESEDAEVLQPLLGSISDDEKKITSEKTPEIPIDATSTETVESDDFFASEDETTDENNVAEADINAGFQDMEAFFNEAEQNMENLESLDFKEPLAEEPEEETVFDEELVEGFHLEAEEHLEEIGRTLNSLTAQITKADVISDEQRELLRLVRRSVHTLKGASGIVGFKKISTWAHDIEDLLDWLYEEAKEINPEIIALLNESADLLTNIAASPLDADLSKTAGLKKQFALIMKLHSHEDFDETSETIDLDDYITSETPAELKPAYQDTEAEIVIASETSSLSKKTIQEPIPEIAAKAGQTLRVDINKIDDLVNLAGELIIALSAFDQKMDIYANTVNELDLSRGRLKEIARDLEVGYEVKAIQRLSQTPTANYGTFGNTALKTVEYDGFDSLELDRYSEFNLIIRSLNESAVDVNALNSQLANLHSDFDGYLTRQHVLLSELQDKLMLVRMVPMSIISNRMHQTVRDAAKRLNKKVNLVIEGEHIELDRLIWNKLTDPLMHLLRNAVDHGIEPPELRQSLGKDPVSILKLTASREGNQVVIRVTDDGAGLNYNAIREKARIKGLSDNIDNLTEDELKTFIFTPGFSTRTDISQISGRGVGLDVVKSSLYDLKGAINLTSAPDKGMQFTIRIPLTLAVVRSLLFKVEDRVYAIPLNEISEIVRATQENIIHHPELALERDDDIIPLAILSHLLNIEDDDSDPKSIKKSLVMVVEPDGRKHGLMFDAMVGQKEIVIKNLGNHLQHVDGIAGATIMGDGSVIPILNVNELLGITTAETDTEFEIQKAIQTESVEILVVDDSVSVRSVVSKLMENQGWDTRTAKDGVEALEKVRDKLPDLIVLDIEMPRMNGFEFLHSFRAIPECEEIPVLMLTSRTSSKHRDKAMDLGASGFVVKPYKNNEFIATVKEQLKNKIG